MPRKSNDVASLVKALKSISMTGKGAYKAKSTSRPYKKRVSSGGGITGRGFYKGFGGDIGNFLGNALGVATGNNNLGNIGRYLGDRGSRATGWGAYKVHHNSLVADIPVVSNPNKEGATQVRHREYIGDVVASNEFTIQYQLPINVGLASTFPWEAVVGSAYQQYQLNGMLYEFVSTSGDITSGSASLGSVCMATQYDSVLPPFTTKLQILNQEFSTSSKPSVNVVHPIECAPSQTTIPLLYTRTEAVPAGSDQRLYDLGVFYLATEGQQVDTHSPGIIGELWCTYDILLYKPTLSIEGVSAPVSGGISHFQLGNIGQNGNAFGSSTSLPNALTNDFGVTVTQTSITFPPNTVGAFEVQCFWYGAIASSSFSFTSGSGPYVDAPLLFQGNTLSEYSNGTPNQTYVANISIATPSVLPVVMNFTAGSAVPSGSQWTSGDLLITQLPINST